jgi:hypothetical protein
MKDGSGKAIRELSNTILMRSLDRSFLNGWPFNVFSSIQPIDGLEKNKGFC